MADVITRFKLETTQYDSKLRDAAKGLKEISHMAELGGKGFKDFTQKQVEAARAFGQVESGANNLKDKVKDLVGSFNEAAKAYNTLTKEQQQTDFGKALAESLTTLKGRITEAKQELYELGDSVHQVKEKSSGGLFGDGGLTGMLQVTGGNLLASGLSKLGSELTDTIQQSIDLARQAEGVHIAFKRLNQPGLLDTLKEATHGTVSELELMKQAIKFENFKLPLKDLATYLAFAQQKAKDTGESIDFLVTSIVNGLGRQSKQILDNLGISAAELTKRMAEGATMTEAVADIIREEMSKAGDYVETAADRAAVAAAAAQDQMVKLGQEAMPVAEQWAEAWNTIKMGGIELLNTVIGPLVRSAASIQNILNGSFKIKEGIPNYADGAPAPKKVVGTDHTVYAPGGYVEVTDANTGKVIGGRRFDDLNDENSIKDWQKSLFKTSSTKSGSKKAPSINDFNKTLGKSLLDTSKLKEVKEMMSPFAMMTEEAKKQMLGLAEATEDLGSAQADLGNKKVVEYMDDIKLRAEQQQKAFELAAQSAANLGNALAGIQDPGVKAAGTVLSAIANLVLSFSQAAVTASSLGPYGWIAYMAAGASALATTISTVHSLTGFQNGGQVKRYAGGGMADGTGGGSIMGTTYSNDQIPILANAGEVILNKAQQATLAQNIQNGGSNLRVTGVLQGTNLLMCIENTLISQGKGQIATWKS